MRSAGKGKTEHGLFFVVFEGDIGYQDGGLRAAPSLFAGTSL